MSGMEKLVTVGAKLLELDASADDGLIRLGFEMPIEEARKLAPFLFEDSMVTFAIAAPVAK